VSFESGSVSFRIFHVPRKLPENAVERFARDAAPGLDALRDTPIHGWVTGRHLLDRRINTDTAYYGGYLRMTLMSAERKIPTSLFRAECRMEELARLQAMGAAFLPQKIRRQIRKEIEARLLPKMPPQLKGISFVYDANSHLLYATALSEKQLDAFNINFAQSMGLQLIALSPASVAALRKKLDVRDWDSAAFSPEVESQAPEESVGLDFMTWLLFFTEARGGLVTFPSLGEFGVILEGPLMFVMEGNGAHEAVLRKGEPVFSAEAKTALLSGKKLRRAKLTLARGDEQWQTTLDAQEFTFRGLKLPEGEAMDPVGRFQERMLRLDTFQEAFFGLFERFLEERGDAKAWSATLKDVHKWLAKRGARK
jgi:hypothetical protein